jgi:hypothetical protein
MRRATTPTHVFRISKDDFLIADVVEAKLTYSQDGAVKIEKGLADLQKNTPENCLWVELTQEETTRFAPGKALLQMRIKTVNGTVYASQMVWVNVEPVLESEVM